MDIKLFLKITSVLFMINLVALKVVVMVSMTNNHMFPLTLASGFPQVLKAS
jgi:hypothetical protein